MKYQTIIDFLYNVFEYNWLNHSVIFNKYGIKTKHTVETFKTHREI